MIYEAKNVMRDCTIVDVDTKETIKNVVVINTNCAEAICVHEPPQLSASGDLITFTMRFRSIYAIRGRSILPEMFHCYGRLNDGQS